MLGFIRRWRSTAAVDKWQIREGGAKFTGYSGQDRAAASAAYLGKSP